MYSVSRIAHEVYGPVVAVDRAQNGSKTTPFEAVRLAQQERSLWKADGVKNIKLLIDGQVMSPKQAERWSNEEYKSLPKCKACSTILDGEVYSHQFCRSGLFCSKDCADKDYYEELEILKDEEDIEYL
jgi:hypothetical protein